MNYVWTFCPKCDGQLTIQYSRNSGGLAGSLRRWSRDRSVNDGRRLDVPSAELSPDGGFQTVCVCGQPIPVSASEVQQASTEPPGP